MGITRTHTDAQCPCTWDGHLVRRDVVRTVIALVFTVFGVDYAAGGGARAALQERR